MSILARKLQFLLKINDLFDRKEKVQFLALIILAVVTALFQALGIASVLPFVNMVMDPSIIQTNNQLAYLYNLFNFTSAGSFIFYSGLVVLGVIVIGNIISALTIWFKISFIWKKNHQLSVALLRKYLSLPYVYFLNQNTADLGKNILSEVSTLTRNFMLPFMKIITSGITIFIILAMLLYVDPTITLIAAGLFISLYLLLYFKISVNLKKKGKERLKENKRRYETVGEALAGIKDIKVLGRENYFLQRFSKHSEKFSKYQSWYQVVGQTPRYIMEIFAFGGVVALVLFLLASDYSGNEIIPLVGFFAFAGYRLMPALQEMFNSFTTFRFNKVVLDKIHKDMIEGGLTKGEIFSKTSLPQPLSFEREINLKNISFFYPETSKSALQNIDIKINKNTSVALTGTTGSGKTTLADIILGLLVPQKGAMKVDGLKISEENVKNWQANLGYVPQQIYLSDDTIARNIAFGLPDEEIDIEQVKKVAEMANINEFIENDLTKKYETIIGERGIRLSGGQRQRIGIARALYHDPKVLVFDEATSSLDSTTEREVLKAIDNISKLKTMIIIAHRLTTIKNCDIIYLIDKGKIVSAGTYDELIENSPQFEAMAKSDK